MLIPLRMHLLDCQDEINEVDMPSVHCHMSTYLRLTGTGVRTLMHEG